MAARFTFKAPKFKAVVKPIGDQIAKAAAQTADDVRDGLKAELRAQVTGAGMGALLAKTWQGRRYPANRDSIDAAAFVYSRAPKIVDAFDRAPVIRPVNGRRYLAIPTDNVPRTASGRGHGRRMTPEEVELAFNQDLKFAKGAKGRLIAYVDVVSNAGGTKLKAPTGKQLVRLYANGRAPKRHAQIVMFVLTPTARMPKRLNVDAAAQHWAQQVPAIFERRFGALS